MSMSKYYIFDLGAKAPGGSAVGPTALESPFDAFSDFPAKFFGDCERGTHPSEMLNAKG